MGVFFETGYVTDDQPTTHARIAHAGNWLAGSVATNGTAAGFFADAPNNSLTYERWKPAIISGLWQLDFGATKTVDYCCIAAHTMGENSNTFSVQIWNGVTYVNALPPITPLDNSPIFAIFSPTDTNRVRINITAGSAPEIGVIRFGSALQMTRPIYGGHAPAHLSRETVLTSNFSETGEFLGRSKVRKFLKNSYGWQHLKADWVRSTLKPFMLAAEDEPFFIAWRPATFSEVVYGQATGPIRPTNMGVNDLMQAEVSVTGRGYE